MTNEEKRMLRLGTRLIEAIGPPGDRTGETAEKIVQNARAQKLLQAQAKALMADLLGPVSNNRHDREVLLESNPDANMVANRALLDCHNAMLWAHQGLNTFKLSRDLGAALILTDPHEDPEAKLPFKSQFFKVPTGVLATPDGRGWITSFHLSEIVLDDHKEARITFKAVGEGAGHQKSLVQTYWAASDPARPVKPVFEGSKVKALAEHTMPEDFRALYKRFVYNFLSWLDHSGTSDKEGAPLTKKQKKAKHPWPKVWLVGKKVQIADELKEAAAAFSRKAVGASGTGWKVKAQHVVRGHWRMQAHGPGRSLRKRLWIEPHMRGPKGEEAWSHMYEAG